ncbi:DUF3108 domain-containing protein [candidate division KSB1 bacterium]|nr:DUF3108 domain-containing protein [candidate division KSB1 bacterium]
MRRFKIMISTLSIVLLLSIIMLVLTTAGTTKAEGSVFQYQVGEELIYKVKWAFLRLGTLRLVVNDTLQMNDRLVYHMQLYIDSNPLLFFVNMHNVYNSYIDEHFRIQLFTAEERIDDVLYKTEYRFNYQDSTIFATLTSIEDPTQIIRKEIELDELLLDGSSLIFYARANVHHVKEESLTTFFEAKKGRVQINFQGEKGREKIDAYAGEIETYYLDGMMDMIGIAGLTGPFKGWFAVDSQRPPIKAKMKVFIGYVTVELEDWKNWDHLK